MNRYVKVQIEVTHGSTKEKTDTANRGFQGHDRFTDYRLRYKNYSGAKVPCERVRQKTAWYAEINASD